MGVRSLRSAVRVRMVLLAVVPSLLIGLLMSVYLGRVARDAMENHQRVLAQSLQLTADGRLDARFVSFLQVAQLLLSEEKSHYHQTILLKTLLGETGTVESAVLLNSEGVVTHAAVSASYRGDVADLVGKDLSGLPDFKREADDRAPHWSVTPWSPTSGGLGLNLMVPVGRQVLRGQSSANYFKEVIEALSRDGTLWFAVVGGDDRVIISSANSPIQVGESLHHLPGLRTQQGSSFTFEWDGELQHVQTAHVLRLDAQILVGLSERVAMAPVYRVWTIAAVALPLVALLAFIVALKLERAEGAPLERFTEVAASIAAGRYDTPLPSGGYSELVALSQAFSNMAAAVQAREASLTRQRKMLEDVARGTADLTGDDFYSSLVEHMAAALDVNCALVCMSSCQVADASDIVAGWLGGQAIDPISYGLANTPCEAVHAGEHKYHPRNLQQLFPDDPDLAPLQAESYGGVPIIGASGRVEGHLVVIDDVPHEFDEAAKSVLAIFAQRVGAEMRRSAALKEKDAMRAQLQQAQKLESLGRLAGGVAHDFNNQLTVILGFCEILTLDLEDDVDALELLSEIRQAAKRSARLTSHLLAFGRKQVLRTQVVALDDTLAEIHRVFRRLVGDDIAFEMLNGERSQYVNADSMLLQQALMNLVINARDAMPRGGRIQLVVEQRTVDAEAAARHQDRSPGEYVYVSVNDTGVGMDEETLKQIFEPFFTTKPVGKGTGLGLAMVYGFVQQSGGFMEVTSVVGTGSSFSICLPKASKGVERVAPAEVRVTAELPRATRVVLVAEDEPAVRGLMVQTLKRAGYTVLSAVNGADALAVAARYDGRINLLVTDVLMPVMKGTELAERIVRQRPELGVLFVTGYADDLLDGVPGARRLAKPFSGDELCEAVASSLHQVRSGLGQA